MKINKSMLLAVALMTAIRSVQASEPLIRSWFTVDSDQFARIYQSDFDRIMGRSETTWSNGRLSQSQPAYSGVQAIMSSPDWVYIRSTGLGSHVMGPWYLDMARQYEFPNLPTDQHFIFRVPRHPEAQKVREFNPLGEIGMFVDGVRMFDANDAFSYSHQNGRDANPRAGIGRGDGIWNRDAFVNEGVTFDAALGHQQNWGRYHYHAEPIALRYLLGDHVDFDSTTKTYRESSAPPTHHSPILGWMQDGFPLYGPYGYSDPSNSASGVRRMISGFVLRDGSGGTDDLRKSGRHALPAWSAREFHRPFALEPTEYGPNVSGIYPPGHYIEDYAFIGDLPKIKGRHWDLDELNGRWCVTPEFPQGTYAYFTTINAAGRPVYPYNMGRRYRGVPSGRLVSSISEPVTTNFVAHARSAEKETPSNKRFALIWMPDPEGGSYQASEK